MIWFVFAVFAALFALYLFVIFLWYTEPRECSEEATQRFLTLVRRKRGYGDDGF